jgi:hypothetical protein
MGEKSENPRGTIAIQRNDDPAKRPKVKPNPAFPYGLIMDCAGGAAETCEVALPYPARGIGSYTVRCDTCMVRVTLTVAGRPDDPARIILPCGRSIGTIERRPVPSAKADNRT